MSSTVETVIDGENSTVPAVDPCLETRYWFYFLSSSLVVFLTGLIIILTWRIFDHFAGCSDRLAARRRSVKNRSTSGQVSSKLPKVGLLTRIKWRCEKLISGQTFFGRIMVTLSCALSIGSLIIYMNDASSPDVQVESCEPWTDSTSQQVDFAFNMFFLVYFVIRFLAANDKLFFWLEIASLVDYFTIPPVFIGIALSRQWLGLRFLRAFRLMSIPDILQYTSVLRTSNSIRLAQLVTIFLSVWFAAAGFIHLVENTGDPWLDFSNAQSLTYFNCAYFAIVTMSTVGYGDIYCVTLLGRFFMIIFIFGALAMFASFIPAIAEIVGRRQRHGGFYEQTVGIRHIVLCGHITYETVNNFLRDFLHEDRQKNNVKCIFLDHKRPDLELEALFKRTFTKVDFFKGSIMSTRDLDRIKLQHAEACLIMANPRSTDPDSEDASNIMRVISVKNYCPQLRVIVQLIRFNNKAFCVNLPSWSARDQVICLSEMKLGFMASGCMAPGFSTLLANLFVMRSYKKSSNWLPWQDRYLEGAGMEVYTEYFSPAFHGMTFCAVAEKCFVRLRLLLVAVAESSNDDRSTPRVLLNPSGRGQHATFINAGMKGFLICQSEDEANRVKFYCDTCHEAESNPEKITRCSCDKKSHYTSVAVDVTNSAQSQTSTELRNRKLLQSQPISGERVNINDVDINVNLRLSEQGEQGELFESTGLFHWCPKRSFKESLLGHDRNRDVMKHLRNHVVVCCFSGGVECPTLGLCNLVMPLRASNLHADQLHPIVLIGDYVFLEKEWPTVCNFPEIYVRPGSPLNRFELRAVRLNRCHMCVILTTNQSISDDPTIVDKESILCSLNIKTMNFHYQQKQQQLLQQQYNNGDKNGSTTVPYSKKKDSNVPRHQSAGQKPIIGSYIPMLTELANDYNVQFLDQDDEDDPDVPLYMTQPFACGRAFAASVLDSLMSTTFFNPELFNLIRTLVIGGDARELEQILAEGVGLIRTDEQFFTGYELERVRDRCHVTLLDLDNGVLKQFTSHNYGHLVVEALKRCGILCIGLYRLMDAKSHVSSYNRYIITNPPADLELCASDQVYCLKPFHEYELSTPSTTRSVGLDEETLI